MPELPEVNTVQKYFDAQAINQTIVDVEVWDDHILRNLDGDIFAQTLLNQTIVGSYRQGKYLFAKLGSGHHVLLHLGMTGDVYFYSYEEERAQHERFHWKLSGGQYMGFNDPRKFGRIVYIKNLLEYLKEIRLGPDALSISELEFLNQMQKRKTNIKAFFLDQHILAGVGNLYADEICYQVRVHPASAVYAIPKQKRIMLYNKMREVLNYACNHDAYYGVYPDNWFWKWRELGMKNPNGQGTVTSTKIAGRTTYYVPGWQKLYQ